jgi:hypothetical protein
LDGLLKISTPPVDNFVCNRAGVPGKRLPRLAGSEIARFRSTQRKSMKSST